MPTSFCVGQPTHAGTSNDRPLPALLYFIDSWIITMQKDTMLSIEQYKKKNKLTARSFFEGMLHLQIIEVEV